MNPVSHGYRSLTFLVLLCGIAVARENSSANAGDGATAAIPSVSAGATTPSLAPGVADIMKMARAGVGDPVILAYIANAATVYNLDANQIVYLHDQGVSEAVISAMLSQKQRYMAQSARAAVQNPPLPAGATALSSQAVYSQPEAQEATASTVYVVPDQTVVPYYGYWSYPCYGFSIGYPWWYGGFGVNHFHRGGYGFRPGFRGGFSSGFRGSFHGRR